MEVSVKNCKVEIPEQKVVLELTVPEFAAIKALVFAFNGGSTPLRKSLEIGMHEATKQLHPHWSDLVSDIYFNASSDYVANIVTQLFKDAA